MKRMTKLHCRDLVIPLILSLCIFSLAAVPVLASRGSIILGVHLIGPEMEKWCWAATMESITDWHGDNYSQVENWHFVKGPGDPEPEGADHYEIKAGYEAMDFDVEYISGVMDWDDMVAEILDQSCPIHVAWRPNTKLHGSVLCGFKRGDPPDYTPLGYWLMDPNDTDDWQYKGKDEFDDKWEYSQTVHP